MKLYLVAMFTQIAIASFAPYQQIIFRNKGYSHSLCGVLLALCQLSAIIMPVIVSSISDKKRRTVPAMVLCALLSIVLSIPFLLSGNVFVVAISSFLMNGFFWCLNPLSDGFITRKLSGDSSKYGTVRSSGTLGYVIALVTFGLLGIPNEVDNTSILKVMIIFLSIFTVIALCQKEEKTAVEKKGKVFDINWFPKRFYIFMGIVALTRFAQVIVEKLLSTYMTENLNLGNYFILFIALGAACEFVCMIFFGKLKKRGVVTSWTLLLLSAIGLFVRLLLYLIPGLVSFTIAQCLHGLTFGALHLAATSYTADNVDKSHYDLGMTIYWSIATNLPQMIGAFIGGFVIESYGYPMLFLSYSLFPLAAAVLCFIYKKPLLNNLQLSKK